MTPRYYHTPAQPVSNRVRCPVCHEAVYSRAGIHPQCAVRQADPPQPKGGKPKDAANEIEGVAPVVEEGGEVVADLASAAKFATASPILRPGGTRGAAYRTR